MFISSFHFNKFVSRGIFAAAMIFLGMLAMAYAQQATGREERIDFDKARFLLQKENSGQKLTAEEQAYLDRAKAARQNRGNRTDNRGARPAAEPNQRKVSQRLVPLTDLGANGSYLGQDGGLYGEGMNEPPEPLRLVALEELKKIQRLDKKGQPSSTGKIVFVSISMSNATQEFSVFKQVADKSELKADHTVVVDCAQGGQAMASWAPAEAKPWQVAMERLKKAGVTPEQVQVAWIKLANARPEGSFDEHTGKLESDTIRVLQNARAKFPNLRIVYLGSRTWAGNATTGLNPEPYAYESAFAVRWLIQQQSGAHNPALALDKAPLLLWGPYLWAEGEKGRKTDDLVWEKEDFSPKDGTHPSDSGRMKVANLLLQFVTTNPLAKSWFTGTDQ